MFIIAKNTFRELIRDRILIVIVFFAALLIVSSLLLGSISLRQDVRIVTDLGLASLSVFSLIITLFLGTKLIYNEVDKKTINLIITKPIRRFSFVIGKFLGLASVILVVNILFTLIFALVLLSLKEIVHPLYLLSILFSFCEAIIIAATAIFFSTFTRPIIAVFATLGVYIAGHLTEYVRETAMYLGYEKIIKISNTIYYITPNLEHFNLKNQVVYNIGITRLQFFWVSFYFVSLVLLLLAASILIFSRKEFT